MIFNIVYLVFVCLFDVFSGVKGILLFIVFKFVFDENGELGECNDVYFILIEYKFGIYGLLMCIMVFGDNEGVIGYLVGELYKGLLYMFIMMNYVC